MAPELGSRVRLLLLAAAALWELSAQGATDTHINPEVRHSTQKESHGRDGLKVRNVSKLGEILIHTGLRNEPAEPKDGARVGKLHVGE